MGFANNCIPIWMITMPYDQWERREISDQELMDWLRDPDNRVPPDVIERWETIFKAGIARDT